LTVVNFDVGVVDCVGRRVIRGLEGYSHDCTFVLVEG
jgi:hypothetical protein